MPCRYFVLCVSFWHKPRQKPRIGHTAWSLLFRVHPPLSSPCGVWGLSGVWCLPSVSLHFLCVFSFKSAQDLKIESAYSLWMTSLIREWFYDFKALDLHGFEVTFQKSPEGGKWICTSWCLSVRTVWCLNMGPFLFNSAQKTPCALMLSMDLQSWSSGAEPVDPPGIHCSVG